MPRLKRSEPPWWLEGADQTCPACAQTYAWSVGVRCVECDEEFCPICIVWIEREATCGSCEDE